MKKVSLLFIVGLVLVSFAATAMAQPKVRIAVLRFEDNTPHSWWEATKLGEAAADKFTTELVISGQFSVIERNRLDDILREHNLAAQGAVTPQTAVELGKLLGVELMVMGSITEFGFERYGAGITSRFRGAMYRYTCKIDVRVVNVQTAEIMYANSEGSDHIDIGVGIEGYSAGRDSDYGRVAGKTLEKATKKLVDELAVKAGGMSTYVGFGRVASVSGDNIYINRGSSDGVNVGDRFTVIRFGDAIIDPDTGQELGKMESEVGVIEVVSVQAKLSICKLVSGEAAQGDMIK
jgi:curli biogenesis system outer membrane secretion channel CsgG